MTLIYYKLEVDYDSETVEAFLANFIEIDRDIARLDLSPVTGLIERARRIVGRILCNYDPFDIRPSHGGGATACRTANHEKWHKLRYYPLLDDSFSYPDYFFYSSTHLADELERLVDAVESIPRARVVLVPKDSRGPRIISCEPAELMYIQQGIMRKLYDILESHPLTKGQLNFVDQGINRELAQVSSETGTHATIDLSDASDRVSLELVRRLFPENWFRALSACRSESTVLPNGEIVNLKKFAPMGSSCCFPVEALVFWAIASAVIDEPSNREARVFVYGDDIITRSCDARVVMDGLESVGLVVNRHKSFVSGPFRESCGGYYHQYDDVTPVLVRKIPNALSNSLPTDVDLCNLFIAKFGYQDSYSIIKCIEQEYMLPFPRSAMQLPGCIRIVGEYAGNDVFYHRRWNNHLQRYEHRILQPFTRTLVRCEAAWSELLRKELTRESRQQTDPDKYVSPLKGINAKLDPGVYADSHSAQLKWRWTWLG
jgi:hypothetical protein